MIGFVLRKTFYDMWDNLLKIVLLNLGFIALVAIPVFLPSLTAGFINAEIFLLVLMGAGIFLCSIYLAAAAHSLKSISDYGTFTFKSFIENVKIAWPAGLVMGAFVFFLFMIASVVLPFYLAMQSSMGLVFAAIVFWLTIFALLSFQFYFTVCARLGTNLIKAFRKCLIISLDNSGFSFFAFLHNIFALVISVILAFMFPGPAGVLLFLDEALRLRLLKYDWLEANPGADRRKIPWDVLLIEEQEKTGTRTFRNFVFPWKD